MAEKCERDDNYFDGWHVATNTSSPQQEANFLEQDDIVDIDGEDDEVRTPWGKTKKRTATIMEYIII